MSFWKMFPECSSRQRYWEYYIFILCNKPKWQLFRKNVVWTGFFLFFLCRLQCAATAGLQPAPVHQSALCVRRWSWSELTVFGKHFAYFSLFWHLLRARSAEGRPHVCVCGGEKLMASTLEPYCSLTVNNPTQWSKIVKICVKLQSGIHESIFI